MKVMFICTGNICRSAMADGLMKELTKGKDVEVYSCGIYAQTGDYATYNSIEAIKKYDVDLTSHRATNIKDSNIKEMDLILCATQSHKDSVLHLYPNLRDRTYTMKEYAEIDENGKDMNINDPWGYDMEIYRHCASEIYKCVERILQKI